ncbi:MAG: ArsR family transcriptional regulator [Merdibacter sp.]
MNKEKQEIISVSQHTDFRMVCELFRQLSDETRIRIFWILCHREECVQEIAALMEMAAPRSGITFAACAPVSSCISRREGKEVYYRAADTKEARFLHQMIEDLLDITCPQERRV